ncbi:two-component system response regulator YesN [Aequitasia blattaphilus]|uniref:Stage 0 sporulation protein A homolog n=1 Tax=Aequitasia blattaphilus TaxID=2949332 RepID=A0ABT1E6P2_9FIRM|nr:response regulator [Aequitasia blattaphilus]MCP1101503.1 response regulator [Aequitasia blattaphilus]MCR8614143.1 response regulator [Aequitasia blattaphilus]
MYKIMIVDDNHLSIEGIYNRINWQQLNAQVTHKVYDGKMSLEILKSEAIDLIISDIEMPQLDGLSLAKEALTIHPNIKIILISAFDKFEYAKQAIRLGAFDYVEKPLNYEYLEQILKKALNSLANEQKNLAILKHSKPLMIDNFFFELLNSTCEEAKYSLDNYPNYLNLELNYRYFQTIIVRVENAKEIKDRIGVEKYHVSLMSISDKIKESLKDDFFMVHILSNFNELIVIIGHNYSSSKYFHKRATEIFTDLSSTLHTQIFEVHIGIGNVVKYLWNLALSYEDASKALEYCFFFPQKEIFDIRDTIGKGLPQEFYQTQHEEELIQLICKKDLDALEEWMNQLARELLANYRTKQLVFIQIYTLLGRLLKFLYEMDIDSKNIEKEIIEVYSKIDAFNNSSEIFKWFNKICKLACEKMNASIKTYHDRTCASVISYVKEHYNDANLSLNNIADYVNVSSSHLSALFKKNSGTNISDIITSVRIDAACQLLTNTTIPLKEISEKSVILTNTISVPVSKRKQAKHLPSIVRNTP